MIPIITIDGPSGSGKGTLAARIADYYGFQLLDSGAFYRLLAFAVLQKEQELGVIIDDEVVLSDIARTINICFKTVHSALGQSIDVFLNDENVTQEIRREEIGTRASKIAALPKVRKALLKQQQDSAIMPGLVADGRDMGTVVFPQALIKFFLTASSEARAERRLKQLQEKGIDAKLSTILADLNERDARDSVRESSPLVAATDAIHIDASALSIEDVFLIMKKVIDTRLKLL